MDAWKECVRVASTHPALFQTDSEAVLWGSLRIHWKDVGVSGGGHPCPLQDLRLNPPLWSSHCFS